MSCQQSQQQCQAPPKCPAPKCPLKCPPASSCCGVSSGICSGLSSGGCCGPSLGSCCGPSSGGGGCFLGHHRLHRAHCHRRHHKPADCCSQPSGGSSCCEGDVGQSSGGCC